MTRRRTSILVLGVRIGTFLLLFSNVIAEVTEASTAVSEKPDYRKASTPQGTITILTKFPSSHPNQTTAIKDGRDIKTTSGKIRDGRDGSSDSDDDSANQKASGEKGDVSTSHNANGTTHANSQMKKSRDELENSSSSDGNRKPRYGEIIAESSGKSTSTKVISEDPLRLSSTNELTIATAKPALNDSKQDGKRNLENATLQDHKEIFDTVKITPSTTKEKIVKEELTAKEESSIEGGEKNNITVNKQEMTTVNVIENFISTSPKPTSEDAGELDEKDKIVKVDYKEVVSKIESQKDSIDLKDDVVDRKAESRDRESTMVRNMHRDNSFGSKEDANDLGTTASEALDLEKIDEKRNDSTISLINDTYVNYNHFHKTSTKKDHKDSSGNSSTNANESHGDPKREVEVVKNVTHLPILRIVATANDTAKNDSRLNELSERGEAVYNKKKAETETEDDNHRELKMDSTFDTSVKSADGVVKRKSIGEPESQVKLAETTTRTFGLGEHTSSTIEATSSPVPQGRTIGFSVVNEFPSIEMKSTSSIKADGEVSSITQSPRNGSTADQRPYPYLKSSRKSSQATTEASLKSQNKDGDVTEETYENTIVRGESEKKLVVTEPSVVIENSIQQQKSDERNVNESRNSTTENPTTLIPVTAIPKILIDVGTTNATFPVKLNGSVKIAEMKSSRSNENNAPGAKEEEKVIAGKDEGYDVTGNGITEVSLNGKEVKSHSSGASESSMSRSTEMPNTSKVPLNTDVQTEPEEAMMIRSTLVVTESTIIPFEKDTGTRANKSVTPTIPAMEVNTAVAMMIRENTTEPAQRANVTLRSSANRTAELSSVTLNPDESSIPTTTSIEFEFVGLTEAISSGANTTERSIKDQTLDEQTTVQHPSAINGTTENAITTMKPEDSTELPVTTEDETPKATDQISTVHHVDNETIEVADIPITQITSVDRSNSTVFTRNEVTTSVIDFVNVTVAAGVSDVTEDPLKSKNSSPDANVTDTSFASGTTELSPNSSVRMIPPTTSVTKSPSTPIVTSTLEPRILWSTQSFTESSEDETTESIQILSSDQITLLVKIIIEDTLHEVCSRLQDLRKALADVLTNSMDKLVLPKQIVIHQNPCLEPMNPSPTPTDAPLTSILVYVVDENGKFDAAMTKILPSLYKMSSNFPVRVHKFLLVSETDSGNAIAVVVVSSVAFICLLLLAGLLFIMRKRQTRFNYGERCRPVSLDAYSLDSVSAYNSVRRKGAARSSKRSYGNPTFEDSSAIPSHPLNFAGLSSFCNDVNAINEEFAGIPQVSAKIDELPPGAEVKNRYANVIPLPETRVPLQRLNNDALTEYINASYVRGPKNATKYYIACQAPIESTVTDFWRMIWEQQCKVIIMLTDLVENEVEKCTEYIPPSEVTDCHRLYGDYQVTLKKRETKEKYAISTLHLKNLENNTFREVFHIWYLWPVSGVQSDGAGLIAVLLEARALQRGGPGPIVVHCSPGTGRTGTLIALDLGIRQYEITRTVDVPRVVYTIRRDRAGAVQTKEQYAFIYKALNLYATKLAGGVLEST